MSAGASNYVYFVKVKENSEKKQPTVSAETLRKYQADVAKYLPKKNGGQY